MKFEALLTEQVNPDSAFLDTLSTLEAAQLMSSANFEAAEAVRQALPSIAQAVDSIVQGAQQGGRLFYTGAGTSGRLGVLDASECPPTFGVPNDLVVGIMAGGDRALRDAVEGAEDDAEAGKNDLARFQLTEKDTLVAISASGYAPYCVGALDYAREVGATAIALVCNPGAMMAGHADQVICLNTGAEVLSGSTRLKAGTATKMALNMLTTLTMVQLGKVYGNLMVDLNPSNIKLRDRARRIVKSALSLTDEQARELLEASEDNPKVAIVCGLTGASVDAAREALAKAGGFVRKAIKALRAE